MATEEATRPEALADVSDAQCNDLDVRPILKGGGEPFRLIMKTASEVPPGGVLRPRATFKPVPLFGAMKMKGWNHWIEFGEADDWCVWFYRNKDVD